LKKEQTLFVTITDRYLTDSPGVIASSMLPEEREQYEQNVFIPRESKWEPQLTFVARQLFVFFQSLYEFGEESTGDSKQVDVRTGRIV
jgi:hypothetical protein